MFELAHIELLVDAFKLGLGALTVVVTEVSRTAEHPSASV